MIYKQVRLGKEKKELKNCPLDLQFRFHIYSWLMAMAAHCREQHNVFVYSTFVVIETMKVECIFLIDHARSFLFLSIFLYWNNSKGDDSGHWRLERALTLCGAASLQPHYNMRPSLSHHMACYILLSNIQPSINNRSTTQISKTMNGVIEKAGGDSY